MSLPEDPKAWFDVQSETLRRIHPSWLPSVPAELIAQARRRPLGRRWLANRLCEVSPFLFGLPMDLGPEAVAELRAAAWLGALLDEPLECALDLGSLAMSATIRTLVNRDAVMKLRTALGAERYARVLASAAAAPESPPEPAGAVEVERDIADRLVRRGAGELAGYAEVLHPAWGESVRLTFERDWWTDMPAATLDPIGVQAWLRSRERVSRRSTVPLAEQGAPPPRKSAFFKTSGEMR